MIIWYQNYIEKYMNKKLQKKGGDNVGHDPMYLWVLLVEEIGVPVENHRRKPPIYLKTPTNFIT